MFLEKLRLWTIIENSTLMGLINRSFIKILNCRSLGFFSSVRWRKAGGTLTSTLKNLLRKIPVITKQAAVGMRAC